MAKHTKIREERPSTVIKAVIHPISTDLKVKISTAFQEVVTKIKNKHLN
jgi:DNA-binding cell septation regulator SpoVG